MRGGDRFGHIEVDYAMIYGRLQVLKSMHDMIVKMVKFFVAPKAYLSKTIEL